MSLSMRFVARFLVPLPPIIGLLLGVVGLSGCSAVRLGYNSGPTLVYWWLDSYFDFDSEQSLRMRNDLQGVQDWHRREELPQLAKTLVGLQSMATKPVTGEQVCAVVAQLQTRVQVTFERITPSIAAIAPTLQDAQLEHMAQEFGRRNRKWRAEWIEGSVAERFERRVNQIVERAESFYGSLESAQLAIVRSHISSSKFDGPRQYREMQRRHQDALQVLRALRNTKPGHGQATADIRALLERTLQAPDPEYRQYMEGLTKQSCAAMAALHNSSGAEQRKHLLQTLQAYEVDVRALASQAVAKPAEAGSPSPN